MVKSSKRVLSLVFAGVLIFNLLQMDVYAEEPVKTEEKVYSEATLEDEFAENRVMVVLDNETSLAIDQFSRSTFSNVRYCKVESLTTAKEAKVQEKMGRIAAELNEVAATRNALEIVTTENIMKIAATDEDLNSYNQVLCIELEDTGKEKVLEAIKELKKQENVIYAGPDYVLSVASTTPDDFYYTNGTQWAINKIQLPRAWDITTGSSTVKVAVIDSGIDGDHPDLSSKIDTDMCHDFTGGYGQAVGVPTDDRGHGTKVAGIIGASGDNEIGITGVCWNVSLVSLKVLDSNGYGYSSNAMRAINYADSQEIPIINFSVGWYDDDDHSNDVTPQQERYDYALGTVINLYSGLFVCAAGNDNQDNDEYDFAPGNYNLNNMITVGSTTSYDAKSWFSNYGKTKVDIFAPGSEIYTTTSDGEYGYDSGTSLSAPYVAGVAALLLSMDSSLTTAELKEAILSSVDVISGLDDYCVTGGRLNAYKALISESAHNYVFCSPINVANHRFYCSDCGRYIVMPHTFSGSSCTECGYSSNIMQ